MKPDTPAAEDAIRYARAEFDVDLQSDDLLVVGYSLHKRANETAAAYFERVLTEHRETMGEIKRLLENFGEVAGKAAKTAADDATLAVAEGLLADQRDTTDRLVTVLENIIKKLDAAGLQFQRLSERYDGTTIAANDLQNEMRAFSTEMVELRDMVNKTRSHALFLPIAMVIGAATFVVGVAAGLALHGGL